MTNKRNYNKKDTGCSIHPHQVITLKFQSLNTLLWQNTLVVSIYPHQVDRAGSIPASAKDEFNHIQVLKTFEKTPTFAS